MPMSCWKCRDLIRDFCSGPCEQYTSFSRGVTPAAVFVKRSVHPLRIGCTNNNGRNARASVRLTLGDYIKSQMFRFREGSHLVINIIKVHMRLPETAHHYLSVIVVK